MNQKILVESLAMDLLRVALGLHRGSFRMAERFKQEALERYKDLNTLKLKDKRLLKLMEQMKKALESEREDKEEDILMCSVLFQNYATHKLGNLSGSV